MQPNISIHRYSLAGLAAILLWSTTIAFSRSLTEQLGTLTAASLIYLVAGVAGILAAARQQRGFGKSFNQMLRLPPAYLWGCGALFVAYIAALYLSVGAASNRSQVLAVGLINYLWPGLSLAFSIPILGRKARFWLPGGIALALAGVWLATVGGDPGGLAAMIREGGWLPYGLALFAAVCWGLYSNLSRRWGSENEGGAVPLFLLASGLLLGTIRLLNPELSIWSARSVLELAYMALFPAMLAYILWDVAMRRGNIILVASLSYLTPLLSTWFSTIVLGVAPEPGLWAGAMLVMVGAILCKLALPDIESTETQTATRQEIP